MKRRIIAIVGPTATGKTGIGVRVAKDFDGEIISADSRQVFRGLDIGSGKEGTANVITKKPFDGAHGEQDTITKQYSNNLQSPYSRLQTLRSNLCYIDDIPQWLIDVREPGEEFNLFEFIELANIAIEDIFSRGKTPVIVGGTGLYIQGLVEGFKLSRKSKVESQKQHSRAQLEGMSREELNNILEKLDKEAYDLVDKNNPHRLIRAIERAQEGISMTKVAPDYETLQIGINWPREVLCERINKRVDDRFDQGMFEEVTSLLKQGVDPNWLMRLGLEYGVITKYIISNQLVDLNKLQIEKTKKSAEFKKMSQLLKTNICQFAKRQTTWFKRFPEIIWENDYDKIKTIINSK